MKTLFKDLDIGDLFNTKAGRWVKTGEYHAISVMRTTVPLGTIELFHPDFEDIIVLYSGNSKLNK
jgi:hypothetical protein